MDLNHNRLPIQLVQPSLIKQWKLIIDLLDSVCYRLFSVKQGSIGDHIKKLQLELERLMPSDIRRSEKIVLEKISEVFKELGQYYSINLTTDEFGETLHAITRSENTEEEDSEDSPSQDRLRIVSPESMDGISKKCIIYLAVDNYHVPALYSESWPFFEDPREEHLDKERYMFLTVLRSVKDRIIFSYAERDGDRFFQPSVYLESVEKLLLIERQKQSILDTLNLDNAPSIEEQRALPTRRYKSYDLNELVHYALCPLRYRLEILHPEARLYRSEWQIQIAAQGVWSDQVYTALRDYSGKWPGPASGDLYDFFLKIMDEAHGYVVGLFPAFSMVAWHAIRLHVKSQLNYLAKRSKECYQLRVLARHSSSMSLFIQQERVIKVNILIPYILQSGIIKYPLLDTSLYMEWLLPGKSGESDTPIEELDEVPVFTTLYHALTWWRKTVEGHYIEATGNKSTHPHVQEHREHYEKAKVIIITWIKGIEHNLFPKHPGNHCKACPVRLECLGI